MASLSISVSMCSCSSPGLSSTWQIGQMGAWLSYRDIFFLPGDNREEGQTASAQQQNLTLSKVQPKVDGDLQNFSNRLNFFHVFPCIDPKIFHRYNKNSLVLSAPLLLRFPPKNICVVDV